MPPEKENSMSQISSTIDALRAARELRRQGLQPVSPIGIAVFVLLIGPGVALSKVFENPVPALAAAVIGLYFMFAIKVARQWDKAAVLRLGRYIGLRGPGLFMIIPVIDSISVFVDQRVRVTDVTAESALTRDTV